MPKSKLRKNHKQKVDKFLQNKKRQVNEFNSLNDMLYTRLNEYNANARRETIVELAYTNRPEFVLESETGFTLNNDTVAVDDQTGVLVWKDDHTAVFQENEEEGNLPFYTEAVVNDILLRLYLKVVEKRNAPAATKEEGVSEADVVEVPSTVEV